MITENYKAIKYVMPYYILDKLIVYYIIINVGIPEWI